MSDPARTAGPYIRWQDYGTDGWQPDSFPMIEAALRAENNGNAFVITKRVNYRVVEIKDKPGSPNPDRVAAGHARAEALSPERRKEIASKAAKKRWAK